MRILFDGVAPWFPTGYGTQTGLWAKRFTEAGHEVIISAWAGNGNCQIVPWEGIPVLASALEPEAVSFVTQAYLEEIKPDLVIILHDVWSPADGEHGRIYQPYNTAVWLPTDTHNAGITRYSGLEIGNLAFLEKSGARPVAMSRDGERKLKAAGYDPLYVPHGIDTLNDWTPLDGEDRAGIREAIGLDPGTFLVGIVGSNIDARRKSWSEQLLAFSKFHGKHPESVVSCSSMVRQHGSNDLVMLARESGLEYPVIRFNDQVQQFTGTMGTSLMRNWYGILDVLLNCSHGEGFGLCAIEAQACGTPVINTNGHTGPELVGPGWLVGGQEYYNPTHHAWWTVPSIKGIVGALGKARAGAGELRESSRAFAEGYDVERVWPYWEKALAELAP
jgi:glycosyltransferase involved in cell wall biosynthesis